MQVTTTVKSYKRPFVGDIYGCGTDVPGYLQRPEPGEPASQRRTAKSE